jgi:drug/metabolite transporter (DMT)-like permease
MSHTSPDAAPVWIPRWILTAAYVGFATLGVLGVIFGSPTLDLTNPDGYTLFWGAAVAVGAITAAVGSFRERWEPIERYGNLLMVLALILYCVDALYLVFGHSGNGASRAVFTGIVCMMTLLPLGRGFYLITRTGIKRK